MKLSRVFRFSLALVLLIALQLHSNPAQGQPNPSIDPTDHRADIRTALLKQTPLGSSVGEVQKFIAANLLPRGAPPPVVEPHAAAGEAAAGSQKKGVKSIRVQLGEYLSNPATILLTAPLLSEKGVSAEWAFDQQNRLIEIFVDKKTVIY